MIERLVSIIVVNWNGKQHLDACLSAICSQSYPATEVLLVDNGSTDGSVDYVQRRFPTVRCIKAGGNLGFCAGNNLGIRQAMGEYIALINNDTEADVNWIHESINALDGFPEAGFTASRIRLFDRRTHLDSAGDLFFRSGYPAKRGWLLPDGSEFDQGRWVFGACGAAAVYRRSMLEQTGLFDEDYFAYMEDVDLSFRAQLMGFRCRYVPTALVYHKVGATAGQSSAIRQYWSHRNHWYTLLKDLPIGLWLRYCGQILVSEVMVLGSATRNRRLSNFFKARIDMLAHLPQTLKKRQMIQNRRNISLEDLDTIIDKNWIAFRRQEKSREVQSALITNRSLINID